MLQLLAHLYLETQGICQRHLRYQNQVQKLNQGKLIELVLIMGLLPLVSQLGLFAQEMDKKDSA